MDRKTITNQAIVTFSRQSLNGYSQNFNFLITGSLSDLPFQYFLEHPSDVDILSWHTDVHISPENSPIPRHFSGQFYKLETCNSPPGFARIIFYQSNQKWTYCGKQSRLAEPNNGPAFTKFQLYDHHTLTSDLVIGLRYSVWPINATEWKERTRHNGWPPNEIIRKIVNDGCHLVMKPHPSHPDDENEWRFSFSLAESTLAHIWNDVQQYIYRTLRLIKSDIVEKAGGSEQTILRTYHFKTLFFWACEQKPSWFWEEIRFETAVKELLCQMIEWLIDGRCPNYFIRSCNLFDCQSIDRQHEINLLLNYVQDCTLNMSQKVKINTSFHLNLPRKLLLTCQIVLNSTNLADPQKPEEVMSSLNGLARSPLLTEEMQWIFKAISIHRDICSDCCDCESIHSMVEDAIKCFSLATKNDMDLDRCPMTVRMCDNVYGIIENLGFIVANCANVSNNESPESKPNFLVQYELNSYLTNVVDVFNGEYVRPSYFLRAAYEANFYYTVLHNYHMAMQICDDAFEVLEQQKYIKVLHLGAEWVALASDCFSIVIIDKWIRLFDEAILVTTGFLALWNAVRTSSENLRATSKTILYFRKLGCLFRPKEKLFFRINPVQFLRYIRRQCSIFIGDSQWSVCINSNFLTACLIVSYRMNAPLRNAREMICGESIIMNY